MHITPIIKAIFVSTTPPILWAQWRAPCNEPHIRRATTIRCLHSGIFCDLLVFAHEYTNHVLGWPKTEKRRNANRPDASFMFNRRFNYANLNEMTFKLNKFSIVGLFLSCYFFMLPPEVPSHQKNILIF